jgi:hypothetical protein
MVTNIRTAADSDLRAVVPGHNRRPPTRPVPPHRTASPREAIKPLAKP